MYNVGINQMYNTVLDGGYPQCPGFDAPESLTKESMLRILEKIIIGKLTDYSDEKIISEEMKRYGYDNTLDALVAFKSVENTYNYDHSFLKERGKLTEKFKKICSNDSIQRVNAEELAILIDTMEEDTPLYLAVFDDFVDPSLLEVIEQRVSSGGEPAEQSHKEDGDQGIAKVHEEEICGSGDKRGHDAKDQSRGEPTDGKVTDSVESSAVTCWTFRCNLAPETKVSSFPAVLCFRNRKVEVSCELQRVS
ncbi:hypothetical protein BEWA_002170 [Theileria equi strain WA]|uniref:Uncharacterized protein n=1 Tax=Theileria equi strain WA TaxID=1537102 RepID=L0AZ21_THEEQ|nr:hypothetical protein BEWA_002170 [Theileria equi strain WA]AFZ80810.1 hypothetical protein BEWA_002170 [Theileria equi strain WA]|eukprot:XP_004830476.1 hypothetical protein BEWA_002170 [Theileria equi strain WA]